VLSTSSMGSHVIYGFSDEPSSMPPNRQPGRALIALWEIFPAAASAVITTCYAVQHENAINLQQHGELADTDFSAIPCSISSSWAMNPGPGMMLGACLTFGCSISSFSYRRQELDRYQTIFFVVAICVACTSGAISGSNPNLIMLGYIPWALCVAIIASALSHWVMRQCGIKTGHVQHDFEENKEAW